MMREFVLPARSAIARRLAYLDTLSERPSDPALAALAAEDLLTNSDLALLPHRLGSDQTQALQALLDQDLRGMLLSLEPKETYQTVLAAVALADARPVVVAIASSIMAQPWERAAAAHGWRVGVDPYDQTLDVLIVEADTLVRQAVIAPRRGGCLVIDTTGDRITDLSTLAGPAREFPRTIVVHDLSKPLRGESTWNHRAHQSLTGLLEIFFPRPVLRLLGHTPQSAAMLRQRGYVKVRPAHLYPLFGTIAHLLGDCAPR